MDLWRSEVMGTMYRFGSRTASEIRAEILNNCLTAILDCVGFFRSAENWKTANLRYLPFLKERERTYLKNLARLFKFVAVRGLKAGLARFFGKSLGFEPRRERIKIGN
jgi:hypothetical protein